MQTLVGGGGMALMAHSNAAQNACRGTLVYCDDKAGRPQQGSGCDKWIINNCAWHTRAQCEDQARAYTHCVTSNPAVEWKCLQAPPVEILTCCHLLL